VELAGHAASKALMATRPYILRFNAVDRHSLLKLNDLILISQAVNPVAELQVLRQRSKMFLARQLPGERWEPVSTTGRLTSAEIFLAGHCLAIVWRTL
jgi:hypothetical protein